MEQEPGKAGEPVPGAPHPDDAPTFEPQIGTESALENGEARSEPLPGTAFHPNGAQDSPIASGSAISSVEPDAFEATSDTPSEFEFETAAPGVEMSAPPPEAFEVPSTEVVPEAMEPVTVFAPSEPEAAATMPDPLAESQETQAEPDWEVPIGPPASPDVATGAAFAEPQLAQDHAAEPIPDIAFAEPLVGEHSGAFASEFPASSLPAPVAVSAWGPPPPAWPPASTQTHVSLAQAGPAGAAFPAQTPQQAIQPAVEEPYVETGPNWMLAFVCLWAAGTALNEAWFLALQVGLTPAIVRNVTVMGYGVLGLGLAGFAIDALQSGKKQPAVLSILTALISALLTLAGVILLVLSNDPGRRI